MVDWVIDVVVGTDVVNGSVVEEAVVDIAVVDRHSAGKTHMSEPYLPPSSSSTFSE